LKTAVTAFWLVWFRGDQARRLYASQVA